MAATGHWPLRPAQRSERRPPACGPDGLQPVAAARLYDANGSARRRGVMRCLSIRAFIPALLAAMADGCRPAPRRAPGPGPEAVLRVRRALVGVRRGGVRVVALGAAAAHPPRSGPVRSRSAKTRRLCRYCTNGKLRASSSTMWRRMTSRLNAAISPASHSQLSGRPRRPRRSACCT